MVQDDEFKDLLAGLNFDFGGGQNEDAPEISNLFRLEADEYDFSTKILKPKKRTAKVEDFICYDNARKLAKRLRLDKGERCDVLVGGDFIFGDFLEAYLTTYNVKCVELIISTLSLSQENIDSIANLISHNYIDKLSLFVSVYFYAHERGGLIPYIYSKLDTPKCDFQLSITDTHTKTIQFKTLGGKYIVCHGSANLRSSGNVEQITLEENPELYNFYKKFFQGIEEEFKTIRKPIRSNKLKKAVKWNDDGDQRQAKEEEAVQPRHRQAHAVQKGASGEPERATREQGFKHPIKGID